VRTIFELIVKRSACGEQRGALVLVEIEADGFLYNMVRTIVGTLVEVGRGTHPSAWISEVLAAADRRAAGQTAPALGLALIRVEYQEVAT
jgi:tRNA pseudouridine38-40 synthase